MRPGSQPGPQKTLSPSSPPLSKAPLTERLKARLPERRHWAAFGAACMAFLALLWLADKLFLPDLTRFHDRSTVVLDSEGRLLRGFLTADDIWRLPAKPSAVNQRFLDLLKAYEDKRFDSHWGVDPLALMRASGQLVANGEIVSGASTLTMQAARLLEPMPRGIGAKLYQMLRALQLEYRYSKDEILEIYLTLAPYGGNLEGVRAASLAYFGKEPDALTTGEAALLVALPQSPERLRPDRHAVAAGRGREKVLKRLLETGTVTRQSYEEALEEPVPSRRMGFPFHAPRLARRLASEHPGGSVIETTIRPALQHALEDFAAGHAADFRDEADIAIIVVENKTRSVIAYLGGSDFWGRAGHVDLARAIRSPGSALKPFIYGLAFDDHIIHPETLIEDRPIAFGSYAPRNFDRGFQGTVTIRRSLQQSLNVPAVAVLDRVGAERFIAGLRQSGADIRLPAKVGRASLPVALGGLGITLQDLTMLFTDLANDGEAANLRFLKGEELRVRTPLFGKAAAWYLTDTLQGVPLPDGWGQARGLIRERKVAFKTGTSYGFRDAWAVGYSSDYTVGAWVGRADASARPGHFGRNDAAPVMLKVFSLLPDERREIRNPPEGVITARRREDLPPMLRHFKFGTLQPDGSVLEPPPRITYPPDNSIIPLTKDDTLPLRAEEGTAPLTWVVNGTVLAPGDGDNGRFGEWQPDGEGFVTLSVVDARGRSARAKFRMTH